MRDFETKGLNTQQRQPHVSWKPNWEKLEFNFQIAIDYPQIQQCHMLPAKFPIKEECKTPKT